MEVLHFSILIDADRRQVWHTMLDDGHYREWTKPFHPGSFYEGKWEEGAEIRFLAHDGEGKLQGMYSRLRACKPYTFISIEHLGIIKNGEIDRDSEEMRNWRDSFENYTLLDRDGKTELQIDTEIDSGYKDMFEKIWPEALQILKDLCEQEQKAPPM